MKYFIEIFLYLIFLFNKSLGENNETILLINDSTNIYYPPYTILTTNNRLKRDKSSLLYPEQCDQHIYTKLYSCAQLTDCLSLSSCLESIHCPLKIKSYGSLILNILHLLGTNNCNLNSSCPNEKRIYILHNLLTYWTDNRLVNDGETDNYCHTISNFINEVKEEIKEQCSTYLKQVDIFLENYFCSPTIAPSSTSTKLDLDWSKLDEALRKVSTPSSSQINYFDEDEEFNFLNTNKNLLNSTEQTVYINDHQYYNVSYIIPKFEGMSINFIQDNYQFTRIHALANRHRSAFGISLKFSFPFYGHMINKILVATGGFIYTGDLLHSALIGSTQYIAPFMANFDGSIGNDTEIKYFDNGTHFVCTWNKIYLQDQQDAGPFTFQAILQNTGNIYFNYVQIPNIKISNSNHAHRLGVSDAYLSQHSTNEHIVRVITLYDKINIDRDKIKNGVSIVFEMDQTCNTFTDCTSCLANRGKRYNCSWCDDIQKCSDGYDRSRQQWIRAQCHRLALEDSCPNSMEDVYDNNHFFSSSASPSKSRYEKLKQPYISSSRSNSAFQTFRTILITLLLSVLVLSLITLSVTYVYAYRNPTSPVGMWLLEHRPSTYIARFKRFNGSN